MIFMTDDKNKTTEPSQTTNNTEGKDEEPLHVQNPFNKNDNKKITPQDIESEQEFKEAQTERD
jgi:hypothetical protein